MEEGGIKNEENTASNSKGELRSVKDFGKLSKEEAFKELDKFNWKNKEIIEGAATESKSAATEKIPEETSGSTVKNEVKAGDKENETKNLQVSDKNEKETSKESPESELKKLEEDLTSARNEYAKKHYKATSTISWIRMVVTVDERAIDDVKEVKEAYGKYRESMGNLLNFRIECIKRWKNEGKMDDAVMKKQMGELIKYFDIDEKINLFESRTNARTEARKEKWGEKALNLSTKFINWHRKLNFKTKMAIGVIAGITGLGIARRGISSITTGVAATEIAESLYRRREKEHSEEFKEKTLKSLEQEDGDKLEKLQEFLNGRIDNYNQNLFKELKSAKNRKLIGVGVGLASAFLIPSLMDKISDYLSGGVESVSGADGVSGAVEETSKAAKELTVEKGSSIEATLAHPQVDATGEKIPEIIEKPVFSGPVDGNATTAVGEIPISDTVEKIGSENVNIINNLHGMYEISQDFKQEAENIQNKIWNLYHGETPDHATFTDNPWDYDKVKQWNELQKDLQNAHGNYDNCLEFIKNEQKIFAEMWGVFFEGNAYPLDGDAFDFLNSEPSPNNKKLFNFMKSMVEKLDINVDKNGHETLLQLSHRISNAILLKGFPK